MGLKSLVSGIASKLVPKRLTQKIAAVSLAVVTSLAVSAATNVSAAMIGESGAGTNDSNQSANGFGYSSHGDSL